MNDFTKERFYLMNGFTERTFLLNDRSVRKSMKWMENERKFLKTKEINLFLTIEKKTNETGRSRTMNARNEKANMSISTWQHVSRELAIS